MKKMKLIYNPVAGDGTFKLYFDQLFRILQEHDIVVEPFRTFNKGDAEQAAEEIDESYDGVIAVGGDGTVSEAACGLLKSKRDIPLGIIPWGTVNDLAGFLKIPKDLAECCRIIINNKRKPVDMGVVNGHFYFINVVSAGFLTDVAYKTRPDFKNIFGRFAYYVKGLEGLPNLKPIKLKVLSEGKNVFEGKSYLIVVLNSSSAGGFYRLAPRAVLDDGKLDVIILKACPTPELISTSIKVLKGEHLKDRNIVYFQTHDLKIWGNYGLPSDVDGEMGPFLPLQIGVKPRALKIFVP